MVFKPSCSTPFTPFLCLVSVYRPFHLYFIPKTLSTMPMFLVPFWQLFCVASSSLTFCVVSSSLTFCFVLFPHPLPSVLCCFLIPYLLFCAVSSSLTFCLLFFLHPPKGGRGCLMPIYCLQFEGCHLLSLSCLLSCSAGHLHPSVLSCSLPLPPFPPPVVITCCWNSSSLNSATSTLTRGLAFEGTNSSDICVWCLCVHMFCFMFVLGLVLWI